METTLVNYQKEFDKKILYIKNLFKLKEKLRFVQLGTDVQSRVEYRYMEKQVDKKIAETQKAAGELLKTHKLVYKG